MFHPDFPIFKYYPYPNESPSSDASRTTSSEIFDLLDECTETMAVVLDRGGYPRELGLRLAYLIYCAIDRVPLSSVADSIGIYQKLLNAHPEALYALFNEALTEGNPSLGSAFVYQY